MEDKKVAKSSFGQLKNSAKSDLVPPDETQMDFMNQSNFASL